MGPLLPGSRRSRRPHHRGPGRGGDLRNRSFDAASWQLARRRPRPDVPDQAGRSSGPRTFFATVLNARLSVMTPRIASPLGWRHRQAEETSTPSVPRRRTRFRFIDVLVLAAAAVVLLQAPLSVVA